MMKYYLRKISRARWERLITSKKTVNDLALNYFSYDMKSDSNTISLWMIEGQTLESIIEQTNRYALVFSLFGQTLTTTDILFIPSAKLDKFNISRSTQDALTAVKGMESYHYNLTELTLNSFIDFLQAEYESIKDILATPDENKFLVRRTETQLRQIVYDAVKAEQIDFDKIDPFLINQLHTLDNSFYPSFRCPCSSTGKRWCSCTNFCKS